MSQQVSHPNGWFQRSLRRLALAAALCLIMAGCKNWNLRGDGFQDNSLSNFCGQCRQPDEDRAQTWAYSNKAQEIERNLGAH